MFALVSGGPARRRVQLADFHQAKDSIGGHPLHQEIDRTEICAYFSVVPTISASNLYAPCEHYKMRSLIKSPPSMSYVGLASGLVAD
jgi:hypothetical protein